MLRSDCAVYTQIPFESLTHSHVHFNKSLYLKHMNEGLFVMHSRMIIRLSQTILKFLSATSVVKIRERLWIPNLTKKIVSFCFKLLNKQ